ncbi:hypothetical protein RJ639_045063 [Escallonia herrerae]|uniref:Vacuolar iron transporter n=1 Tax=Escallonia herrerae TaxID=1293975 RepID=A0AA88WBY9_9ASTE|nr:hypothetical protein RJ639_045063 [Escallonia herrerae]
MATAEFVSVYVQVDAVKAQEDRDQREGRAGGTKTTAAPSPTQVAVAASVAFVVGGILPLLAAFAIKDQQIRVIVAAVTAWFAMLVLGNVVAALGKASVARSCARVFVGGWIEIAVMVGRRKALELYGPELIKLLCWDQGLDDDWDEEKAVKSLGTNHVGSKPANGLTSRSSNSDGWENIWDD